MITAAIAVLGTWIQAKKQFEQNKDTIIPAELSIILDTWRKELERNTQQISVLLVEKEDLTGKIKELEKELSYIKKQVNGVNNETSR